MSDHLSSWAAVLTGLTVLFVIPQSRPMHIFRNRETWEENCEEWRGVLGRNQRAGKARGVGRDGREGNSGSRCLEEMQKRRHEVTI